ncbi:MAG: hypothetical protein ABGZ53_12450 [Fuerstiella sp.]
MTNEIPIGSSDYWFKVIDFLQQNWALIEPVENGVTVYFLNDDSNVFDELQFKSMDEADSALQLNEFRRFADDPTADSFLRCPAAPFFRDEHSNRPIYSSGDFWRSR